MTPIILIILIIMIFSCFTFGFLYNEVFLYAACVLCIILGLLLLVDGIDLKIAETSIQTIEDNQTTTLNTYEYTKFDSLISGGVGLLFILLGLSFIYFEKKGRNDGYDQWGQDGKWL
jgi:uncharacterized membrane protein